ncbi:MAG: hypothetical protein ACI9P5_004536 [Saprospiraceae bacterium]
MIRLSYIFFLLFIHSLLAAQCDSEYNKNQSLKIANYDITVDLDHKGKVVNCHQTLRWKNTSPDTIKSLRFYMYMNAFKDMKSSYLRNSGGKIFGRDIADRSAEEWGHISIDKMLNVDGVDLVKSAQFIQPDDGNINDHSILEIPLENLLLPGKTGTYEMDFTTKMPKTIARSGYSQKDFFLFVHWFPQVCVYEQDKYGTWGWNSHQFVPGTEFFADFGDYKVTISASSHLQIGGSGCRISESKENNRQTVELQAHDLIDFGFVVYSEFDVYKSSFQGVDIEILMPPEHSAFADRYRQAIEHGLEYMNENVGPYPYPKITVVDPPVHALNSGFMEYPMMITAASFYGIPKSIRSVESLVIHEFVHMYFMATLASNEKEEAWLDEGFVTYYEDRITDHFHGKKLSFFNVLGFRSGNAENSRLEYTKLDHSSLGPIAKPGWEIKGPYKGLIYAKTSSMLKTLEGLVGRPAMDKVIQTYYQSYKFKHPKEADFRRIATEVLSDVYKDFDLNYFFEQCLHGTEICDYEVVSIENTDSNSGNNTKIVLSQNGGLQFPVSVEIIYENESVAYMEWDGTLGEKIIEFEPGVKIKAVNIDPNNTIALDINFNNNSLTYDPNKKPIIKYAAKSTNWMQTILEYASFLF